MKLDKFQSTLIRKDVLTLLGGVLFSLVFTTLIWYTGQWLARFPHLPDQGAVWYYWKLPQPTFWGRASAWTFYIFHQLTLWGLIYYAQTRVKRYSNSLHNVNLIALGANAFFIILHLVQSQIWYDGLAQDMSIWSSQGSVVILLVWVLLMENQRRGLFFGKRAPISKEIIRFVRKYHGYFFAWAVVYTFWFHPTENTSGHLIGFFYMFLLLLQGSLFFTRIHINRWWTAIQEVMVLAHGTLVAVMQGNGLWPMFAFGFGGVFVITQMHGLGLSRLARGALLTVYIAGVVLVYNQRGWEKVNEIVRIPAIDYVLVFALAGLIGGGLWVVRRLSPVKKLAVQIPGKDDQSI